MIMHFKELHAKHGGHHSYVKKMVLATIHSGISAGDNQPRAVSLLCKWGDLIKKEWKADVLSRSADLLGRASIVTQLESLNKRVANMLNSKNEMLQQLVVLNQSNNALREEVSQVRTQLGTIQDVCCHLATQNRLIMSKVDALTRSMGREPPSLPELPANAQRTSRVVNNLLLGRDPNHVPFLCRTNFPFKEENQTQ